MAKAIGETVYSHSARIFSVGQGIFTQRYFVYRKGKYRSHSGKGPLKGYIFLQGPSLNYSWGPASTRALPSSLPVYLVKFLMKRAARSFAFSSQIAASA